MQHPVVWFEVTGNDAARLRGFYSELFGWSVATTEGSEYAEVDTKSPGKGIPGGIGPAKAGPWVTFYVATPDLAASLAKATSLGAKTLLEPTEVGGGTRIALFRDPEGHTIGLVAA
ncbi:MAG TPA: VOC family protein [Nannocystaceae bacterium]|nr:VOC family protein [Nannocystaceae bacterium]